MPTKCCCCLPTQKAGPRARSSQGHCGTVVIIYWLCLYRRANSLFTAHGGSDASRFGTQKASLAQLIGNQLAGFYLWDKVLFCAANTPL